MKIAVFIDRDGTINQETGYVDSFDRFHILPRIPDAIKRLNENNIPAIIITNQSGVARGYFTIDFVNKLHEKMGKELERKNCSVDAVYTCPHHPDEGCACRKPKPGMLLKAAKEHGILLRRSYVIGDKIADIKTAHSVGAKGILVLTGYGAEEIKSVTADSEDRPDHVAPNLYEAVTWVLRQTGGNTPTPTLPHQGGGSSADLYGRSPTIPSPLAGEGKSLPPKYLSGGGRNKADRRILIVKPSSLGDIVHSLPVLWVLRQRYPDAHIGWVVKEAWKDILTGNPLIDEVIVLNKGAHGIISTVRKIRETGYDTVIDLQGLFRSGLITILSGAKERIGFSNAREFSYLFYNKKVVVPSGQIHAVDRYLLTVSNPPLSLIPLNPPESPHPPFLPPFLKGGLKFPLYVQIEDAEWAKEFLVENNLYNVKPIVAINPSARWEKKRWPATSYAALINHLIKELKAGIIVLGSKEDIPVSDEISSLVDGKIAIAAGKTSIKRLAALIERTSILVTNDSGPMHIAAALGIPVIALFGPTNPHLTGPYGNNHIVIEKTMDCRPCLRKPCVHGMPVCMEMITAEEVMEGVRMGLGG